MIRLSDAVVKQIIEVITHLVTKEVPEADKATHPMEMGLIDFLVEKRNEMEKQTTAELLDEYIWGCLEARRQLLCERPEDDSDPKELSLCNLAIAHLNMRGE